ncbi:unnamed protein product [Closterium sp. NIES-64]|nr:unnamed protein product [Closterium sp. NIES-64]
MAEKVLPGVRVLLACGVPPRDMALGALYDSVWLGQPAEKINEVVRYLNELGLTDGERIGTVLRRFPRAFAFDPTTQLQPRVQKLLDMGIKDTSYIIKACPRLLQLSSERVQERLDFLAQVAGEGHVSAIVQRQPYILTQPISELQSKLDAFQSILGSETLARKVFRQIRRLPAHSASKMISTFHTLCEIVGGAVNAQQVVEKRSSILATNSTTMLSNFNHWRALLPQLSPSELSHLFVRYPALLHLSWKSNIAPKAEFFLRELGLSEAAVVAVPLVACYSLEQRIRPRIQRVRDAGVKVVERGGGIVCLPRCVVDGEQEGGGDGGSGATEEESNGGGGRVDDVRKGKGDAGARRLGRKRRDAFSGVRGRESERLEGGSNAAEISLSTLIQLPVAIAFSLAGGVALLLRRRGRRKRDDAIRESAEEVAEAGEGGEGEGGEGEYGDPGEDDEELAEGDAGDEAEMGEEGDAGEAAEAAAGLKLLREEFEAALFDGKEFDIDWDEFPYHIRYGVRADKSPCHMSPPFLPHFFRGKEHLVRPSWHISFNQCHNPFPPLPHRSLRSISAIIHSPHCPIALSTLLASQQPCQGSSTTLPRQGASAGDLPRASHLITKSHVLHFFPLPSPPLLPRLSLVAATTPRSSASRRPSSCISSPCSLPRIPPFSPPTHPLPSLSQQPSQGASTHVLLHASHHRAPSFLPSFPFASAHPTQPPNLHFSHSNHAKEHLLASFFVHLKRTRLAKFVACFPNLSNWILLSGPHGSEVYQDTLVRAIARKLNARLIAVDADKFLSPADMSSVPKRRPAADKPRDSLDSAGLSDSLDSPLVSSSPLRAPLPAPPLPPSLATSRPLPLPSLPCPSLPCPSLPCPSLHPSLVPPWCHRT